jgi:CBS domain containing-hemolysin-like protein
MTLLIVFFLLSIGFSFLCSIWEAVLLSVSPSYINTKVQAGSWLGDVYKGFRDDIDKPLSAILTLNTIAHTMGAIGVGIEAGKLFGSHSWNLGVLEISIESVIASVMTLAILILSEIIPKTLGANYWRSLAPFTAHSLRVLLMILVPFVWMSQLITKNLKKEELTRVFSRADFRAMAQAGEESGVLRVSESSAIKNLLRLDSIPVKTIMTPRMVMLAADKDTTLRQFYDENMPLRFSRIPIFDDHRENIIGIFLKNDLFKALLEKKDNEPLSILQRDVIFANENANLSQLQNLLMKSKAHIAIVVNDFGAILGLVTMEDLFETILGLEIVDETDDVADLQKHAREIWQKRARELGLLDEDKVVDQDPVKQEKDPSS